MSKGGYYRAWQTVSVKQPDYLHVDTNSHR